MLSPLLSPLLSPRARNLDEADSALSNSPLSPRAAQNEPGRSEDSLSPLLRCSCPLQPSRRTPGKKRPYTTPLYQPSRRAQRLSLQSTKAILHFCPARSRLADGANSVRFFASTTRLLAGQKSAYKPVLKCLQFLCGCSKIASASPILGNFRQTPDVSGPLPSFQAASKKPCKMQFQNCIFKHSWFFVKFRQRLNLNTGEILRRGGPLNLPDLEILRVSSNAGFRDLRASSNAG